MIVGAGSTSYSVDFIMQLNDSTIKDLTAFEHSIVEAFPSTQIDDITIMLLTPFLKIVASK